MDTMVSGEIDGSKINACKRNRINLLRVFSTIYFLKKLKKL